ncbi:MAG TPA: hypothetical protein VIR32_00625 [Lachnospiraceae bacterium]
MKKRNLKVMAMGLAVATSLTTVMPVMAQPEETVALESEVKPAVEAEVSSEAAPVVETPETSEAVAPASETETSEVIAPETVAPVAEANSEVTAPATEVAPEAAPATSPAVTASPEVTAPASEAEVVATSEAFAEYKVDFNVKGAVKPHTYKTADELIGGALSHGAADEETVTFLGVAADKKYFVGWSTTQDYAKNGGKMYYASERASTLVADKVTTLYPVYFSMLDAVGKINKNTAYINRDMKDAETMPNAELHKEDVVQEDHKVVVKYDETKDNYSVVLTSSFDMDKMLSHWLYVGNGSTIMTNTQSEARSTKKDAKYTHVDLNVNLGDELDINDTLKITFKGYYFQPYMAFDTETGEKFKVEGANGDGETDITELVTSTSPETTFTIKNPKKSKKITVRTIVRSNWGFGGKPVIGVSAREIESSKMLLSAENATISKENAKKLEENDQATVASGVINGYVKMPNAPIVGSLDEKIADIVAKDPMEITFRAARVMFDKNSMDLGDAGTQDLGISKVAYNGSLAEDSLNAGVKPSETVVGDSMADTPADFKGADGASYRFKEWNTMKDGKGTSFTETTKVPDDITVYAIWEKEEAPQEKPEDKPNVDQPEDKPNVEKPEDKPNVEKPEDKKENESKDEDKSKKEDDKKKSDKKDEAKKPEKKAVSKSKVESKKAPKTGVEDHAVWFGFAAAASVFTMLFGAFKKKSEVEED